MNASRHGKTAPTTLIIMVATFCAATLMPGPAAHADGKFFTVPAEAEPTIPFQRALICYKEGVETLIVESTAQAAGERIGWVVPLPAEPTTVTACKPGLLKTMHQLTGPRIKTSAEGAVFSSVMFLVVCILVSVIVWRWRARRASGSTKGFAIDIVLACVAFLACAMFMLPMLATVRGFTPQYRLEILSTHQVGAYGVTIVRGETGQAIRDWLASGGFQIPDGAQLVLDDYVKRGWCFAASQLNTEGRDAVTPHPLKFVFATDRAVYPMKLTGVGAQDMQLDLFVVADEAAIHPVMEPILVAGLESYKPYGRFSYFDLSVYDQDDRAAGPQEMTNYYGGGVTIGHPDAVAEMWPDCVLTHLRGTLDPAEMTEDYYLDFRPYKRHRKNMYTPGAAGDIGLSVSLTAIGLVVVLLTATARSGRKMSDRRQIVYVLLTAVVVVASGLVANKLVPIAAVGPNGTDGMSLYRYGNAYHTAFERMQERWPLAEDLQDAWPKLVAEAIDERPHVRAGRPKPPASDVPGGYEVRPTEYGWELSLYDEYATPLRLRVGKDGKTLPAS